MSRDATAFVYVLIAGVLWAMQPVLLLIISSDYAQTTALLFWNLVGSAALSGLAALLFTNFARVRPAFRTRARTWRLMRTVVADGIFISGSYLFLINFDKTANILSAAILFETWPIFSTVILLFVSRRPDDLKLFSVISVLLFLAGFLGVTSSELRELFASRQMPNLNALVSGILMAGAVVSSQVYLRSTVLFASMRQFSFFMFLRLLFACLFLLCYAGVADLSLRLPSVNSYAVILGFGALVVMNSYFFHLGSRRLSSNSTSLIVLISPALAPIALFALGYGAMTQSLLAGSAAVFAGIAIASRGERISPQFLVVLLATILVGSLIVYLPGHGSATFYAAAQTISVFYGLFQASALATLIGRHDAVQREFSDFRQWRRRRDLWQARIHLGRIGAVQKDTTAVSELVLLTCVGLTSVAILIVFRGRTPEQGLITYLIAITIVYLLVISWVYHIKIAFVARRLSGSYRRIVSDSLVTATFSRVLSFIVFLWFLLLIGFAAELPVM